MATIKRSRSSTTKDLQDALNLLIKLLAGQGEDDAIVELKEVSAILTSCEADSPQLRKAISRILEAFEGELELIAYTHQRDGDQWTEAEELSQASSRVLSLARRLR